VFRIIGIIKNKWISMKKNILTSVNIKYIKEKLIEAKSNDDIDKVKAICNKYFLNKNIDFNNFLKSNFKNYKLSENFTQLSQDNMFPNGIKALSQSIQNKILKESEKKNNEIITQRLKEELYFTVIILDEFKKQINDFIRLERELFKYLFFGQYNECLILLNKIDSELCISQWSLHFRLTIYELNNMKIEQEELIKNINDDAQSIHLKIFLHLHFKKLGISKNANYDTMISEFKNEKSQWKNKFKRAEDEEYKIFTEHFNDKYYEKLALSPFNSKSEYKNLLELLFINSQLSIIDLYKTYASIITELQIDEANFFKTHILEKSYIIVEKTYELSYDANIIKLDNYTDIKNIERRFFDYKSQKLNLLEIFNDFLFGNFELVADKCISGLEIYPYSMDLIYFLVHSIALAENLTLHDSIIKKMNLNQESLLYKIISNYLNILKNIDIVTSIEELKKLLLYFGSQSQWNMYLYHLISQYLCLNTDIRDKKFSNSIKYSYFNHPRIFYNLDKEAQDTIVTKLLPKYPSVEKTYSAFLNNSIDTYSYINPEYRNHFIAYRHHELNNASTSIIRLLYTSLNDKIPFFYRLRITLKYVSKLVQIQQHEEAIKIIIDYHHTYKIPLCMFSYKNRSNQIILTKIQHLPHYPLLIILDRPKDTIAVHYAMKSYLNTLNGSCNKISEMEKYISEDLDTKKIQLLLLNKINKEYYINENILILTKKKKVIREQLTIINIVKNHEGSSDLIDEKIRKLNDLLSMTINTVDTNKNRILLNIDMIKNNIIELFEMHYRQYEESEFSDYPTKYFKENEAKTYQPIYIHKEEHLISLFNLLISGESGIVFSNFGISNAINENIIHNHFDDTLIQVFLSQNLYAKTDRNNNFIIDGWELNKNIQQSIINFTVALNNITDKYKKSIQIENIRTQNHLFDLSFDSLIDIETFKYFLEENEKYKFDSNAEQFLDILISTVLNRIKNKLNDGQAKLVLQLKIDIENALNDNFNIDGAITPLRDATQSIKDELNNKTYNTIMSWFNLNEKYIHKDFYLKEVIDTLGVSNADIKNISIINQCKCIFKGKYFITIWKIYSIILHNVAKHSNIDKKELVIEFISENDTIKIIHSNQKENHEENNISRTKSGIEFIKNNLKYLHGECSCTINDYKSTDKYIITLYLSKEIVTDEE